MTTFLQTRVFLFFAVILYFFLPVSKGFASSVSVGASFLESGDDILTPGASLHFWLKNWGVNGYYFQKVQAPVTIETRAVDLSYFLTIPSIKYLKGSLGVAYLAEITTIDFKQKIPEENNQIENSQNLGLHFGLTLSKTFARKWLIAFNWNSHLFNAGSSIIFLVTGRKEMLSLSFGYEF